MKKILILIVSIIAIFLYYNSSSNSVKTNKNSNFTIVNNKKDNNSTLLKESKLIKKNKIQEAIPTKPAILEKNSSKLERQKAFFEYRKAYNQREQARLREHFIHQSKLKQIHQGGTKTELVKIKQKKERVFKEQYQSSSLHRNLEKQSKKRAFLKHNEEMLRRERHMQSIMKVQRLQQPNKGD